MSEEPKTPRCINVMGIYSRFGQHQDCAECARCGLETACWLATHLDDEVTDLHRATIHQMIAGVGCVVFLVMAALGAIGWFAVSAGWIRP